MRHLPLLLAGAVAVTALSVPATAQRKAAPKKPTLDFNRDVRPILGKCFNCHGADPKTRAAGLRLDVRAGAVQTGVIVPGKPDASRLIQRIETKTEALRMPPASSNMKVSAEERKVLRQWIAEGATYKEHWAFIPPQRPDLPAVRQTTWLQNPIDSFILAKLEERGLKPSPPADRATLIRRVTLDLTGLPPTPSEVDAFVTDRSPNAYEKVVDRLLASPKYGERMAMDWMDYARYADSNGYQADYERFQWRWRDWVIDAYNRNMPYDRFTVEQLAGDMLPNATLDQKIATGFNRNHRINTEGGVIAEEWRVENVIDRVETTTAVWLGLTAGCARCHDHKYDPLSQKEFYSLFAYFNNVPESGTGEERPVNHPPFITAPTPTQVKMMDQLRARAQSLEADLGKRERANLEKVEAPGGAKSALAGPATRVALTRTPFLLEGPGLTAKAYGIVTQGTARSTGAVRVTPDSWLDLGSLGDFDGKTPFGIAVWVYPEGNSGSPVARMQDAPDHTGWDFMLQESRPAFHLISKWPTSALKVIGKPALPTNQWSHLAVSSDGSGKAGGVTLYINGQRVEVDVEVDRLTGSASTKTPLKIGRRETTSGFMGMVDDLVLAPRALTADEVAALANEKPGDALRSAERNASVEGALARLWSEANDVDYRRLSEARDAAHVQITKVQSEISTVMVMEEMPKPRTAYLLRRGQYDQRGEAVPAGVPKVLPGLPKGTANNRLGFARWVVAPNNPLTARVTMNRFWDRFFGIGIVETVEDFGTRAEFPTHPELLDWLATEFVRTGWDQKAMMRLLVTSNTYRQSSRVTKALLEADPRNRYHARAPRLRLPAEVLRDQALAAAGLLNNTVGGPGVRPYQPEGIWDETNVYGNLRNYKNDTDGNQFRRSLYTIWKRTAAPPTMTLFDASTRETCRVTRARTNTPLQALALMNDVTIIEAARVLAERSLRASPDGPKRIEAIFRRVLGRRPSAAEAKILQDGVARRIAQFRLAPDRARALVRLGTKPVDERLDPVELAAYTLTASNVLNLDEAITKE